MIPPRWRFALAISSLYGVDYGFMRWLWCLEGEESTFRPSRVFVSSSISHISDILLAFDHRSIRRGSLLKILWYHGLGLSHQLGNSGPDTNVEAWQEIHRICSENSRQHRNCDIY